MSTIPQLGNASDSPFPLISKALDEPNGLLAWGGDLSTTRLLNAYSKGVFPWFSEDQPILWWSPNPRMVFDPCHLHIPRRLHRWLKNCTWEIHSDQQFNAVIDACAQPRAQQDGTWISDDMQAAYIQLHLCGHAHSIEVYEAEQLIGGLYGVCIGHMFFAESMFSKKTNASKVALLALAQQLRQWQWPLLDAQVYSAHLTSLGAFEMSREHFCAIVAKQTAQPELNSSWQNLFSIHAVNQIISC